MNRGIHRRPQAIEDLSAQYSYYVLKEGWELAERYLSAVEETLMRLLEQPKLGARRDFLNPQLIGLRMLRVQDFEHQYLYYLPREDGLELIRVLRDEQNVAEIIEGEL